MTACRGCGKAELTRVLDLGKVPAADYFPLATDPVRAEEASHALAMDVCCVCGLAQLADDDTVADEPRGVEPQALKDQAEAAIERVAAAGWLRGNTVLEFGSPHGGTWIPLLTERGFTTAIVAGGRGAGLLRHHARTATSASAFERRAQVTAPGGVLLLQYHSIVTIVGQGQWNALRHGHFAYYSLTTLMRLLGAVGMRVVTAWEFDLYGGTVLLAAVHGEAEPDESVQRILATEDALGMTESGCRRPTPTQRRSARRIAAELARRGGARPGAPSSRTAPRRARWPSSAAPGSIRGLLAAVADASPAKQGRRMPGTDIPIVSPDELLAAKPDRVLLDASRSVARGQRTFSRARRPVEGRRPVTLRLRCFHLKGRYQE